MIFDTIWAPFFLLETKKNYSAEPVSTIPLILMQELLNIIIRWDWQSAAIQLHIPDMVHCISGPLVHCIIYCHAL
jgi:hypothetical protein